MSYTSADMEFQEYEERKHYSRAFQIKNVDDLHKAFAFLSRTGRYNVMMESGPLTLTKLKFHLKSEKLAGGGLWNNLEILDYLVSTSGGDYYVMNRDAFEYTFVERQPLL